MLSGSFALTQEQLDSLLQVIDSGIQVWDGQGRLIYANPATWTHFAREPADDLSFADLSVYCYDSQEVALPMTKHPVARMLHGGGQNEEILTQVRLPDQPDCRWLEIRAHPLQTDRPLFGQTQAAVLTSSVDVTALKIEGMALQQQAHYDALTCLPNRILLADRVHMALAHARRHGELLAVCLMDLDGFKPVNDTLGHKAGDQLLQEIARRLQETLRQEDTAARIGGDEFALLVGGIRTSAELEPTLQRVLDTVAAPIYLDGHSVRVSASIGVTLFPGDVYDADQLMRHADQAMYKAKEEGKNRYHIYDPAIASQVKAKQGLLKKIEDALAKGQFSLYYQPKVDCRRGEVAGLEALVRWNHPILGLRAPGEFLPLIEQDDLIIRLGEWVIATALQQMSTWAAQGMEVPVSINISARHFLRSNFRQRLATLLEQHPPELLHWLEIEIVETAALEDINLASELIREYRGRGVAFALDDFGTGYSSLVHLKRLAVNTLKIDQTFVRDMLDDPGDLAIVQGIVGLAAAFQEQVVAEGVESIEQILMLLELGCNVMQGYGIARPMPADKVPEWLEAFRADPRWQASGNYPLRSDFDLLLMEVAHRHWLDKLLTASAQGHLEPLPAADFASCRLSRWYEEDGRNRYGFLPEFRALEQAHWEVHRVAENLAAQVHTNEHPSEALRQHLIQANQNFVALLHNFRVALAAELQP